MKNRILVVCEDLFFWAKIHGTAASLGLPVLRVPDVEGMQNALSEGGVRRILVDLGSHAIDVMTLPDRIKALVDPPEMIGFASHVDEATQARARAAGYDLVLPRSRFSSRLREYLAP